MEQERNHSEAILTGIIIPTNWSKNGTPCAWGLSAIDEKIYQIDMRNKNGQELKKMLKKKIKITGRLVQHEPNKTTIQVRSFVVLD